MKSRMCMKRRPCTGNEGIVLGTISVEVNTAVHHIKILRWIYMEYMIKSCQILSVVVLSLAKLFTCLYLFWDRNVRNLQKLQEFWPSVLIFFFLNKTNISHNLRYNYIERSSSKPKLTWHWFSVILRKMGRGDAWSKGNKSEVLYSLNKPKAAWSNGNRSTDSVV